MNRRNFIKTHVALNPTQPAIHPAQGGIINPEAVGRVVECNTTV